MIYGALIVVVALLMLIYNQIEKNNNNEELYRFLRQILTEKQLEELHKNKFMI